MDFAHELQKICMIIELLVSFNPCFSGSCSRIVKINEIQALWKSFNPCFSGSCSRIVTIADALAIEIPVSILVLVDLAHESLKAGNSVKVVIEFQSLF